MTTWNGPATGAQHLAVDIGVVPHIDGTRCARADGNAEQGRHGGHHIHAAGRQHQTDQGREDHQAHHPWLQQRQIVQQPGAASLAPGALGIGNVAAIHLFLFLLPPHID